MSEKYKFVTVKGREYRINKFSATTGTFVLAKVSSVIAPAMAELVKGLGSQSLDKPDDILKDTQIFRGLLDKVNLQSMFAPLSNMSEQDFMYVQQKCLGVCQVNLSSGYVPAMHANGSFSIAELEDDSFAVMALMVHALIHNFAGFFSADLLKGSHGDTRDSNSQN